MSKAGLIRPMVVLASASPRRLELLQMFGLDPVVFPADVDETPLAGEKSAELVERLCRHKAETTYSSVLASGSVAGSALVIAADTVIDIEGSIFGKPNDEADAATMLEALSGRSHDVVTGMAVVGMPEGHTDGDGSFGGRTAVAVVNRTSVFVKTLTAADIAWYIDTGEPMGKAGAYAIQGLGSSLIDRIEGSYQSVVGLSLRGLDDLTSQFGHPLRSLAKSGLARPS